MTNNLAVFIPIKGTPSKRVPMKNFRVLGKLPLLLWTLNSLQKLATFGINFDIYIDTESNHVYSYCLKAANTLLSCPKLKIRRHQRRPELSEDTANGNHLLDSYVQSHPQYLFYMQTHITTPFTCGQTYRRIYNGLITSGSVYSASYFNGWIRQNNKPINYDCSYAEGLGRSQDKQLLMETTDTYAVSREFFINNKIRSNESSMPIMCSDIEAIDIDTELDYLIANYIAQKIQEKYNFIDPAILDLGNISEFIYQTNQST